MLRYMIYQHHHPTFGAAYILDNSENFRAVR